MYKKLFLICVFVTIALTQTQPAAADYRITNGSTTEPAWVVYSAWRPANWEWPEGWRTQGYYKLEPGDTRNLSVPQQNTSVYIYVERTHGEVKPPDHATRNSYRFWIHPSQAFTVVETDEGDFLKSDHNSWNLERADLYEYRNGGSHTIVDEPRLRDRPARQIHDEALPSLVWIETLGENGFGKGSGVLIDKKRRLVVTNEHVIRNATHISVFFPWRDANEKLNRDEDFYFENWEWLDTRGYHTDGRVVAKNARTDLAIIQLNRLTPTAHEIKRDFSRNVEDSMRPGDKVHILGNPGNRLWNWTQGTFLNSQQTCLVDENALVGCLVMEGDAHGGNSGGPVLNGQGVLIGILTGGNDATGAVATPARNVRALLRTVPANVVPVTYPKRAFKIRNRTGVTVPYQIKWSNSDNWKSSSLETGFIITHRSSGQSIPSGYPKIRFDYIAGDQWVTHRVYKLESAGENANVAPTYRFQYNRRGDRLDLYPDGFAAPALSREVPKDTVLLSNYPNPFNPETWIPYHLAKPAEVTVTIYAADGRLARTLALGHQPAGVYQDKSRAVYWDGKNELGEPVASGVYFYTLTAGDFTATRKMLIIR